MSKWLNCKTNQFIEDKARWYNLSTNRFVKNYPKNNNISWSVRGIKVLGTTEQISEFININKLDNNNLKFRPTLDIKFLSEDACLRTEICKNSSNNSICVETDDVEKLSESQLDSMNKFNLGTLFVKAKVTEVIDGDTVNVAIYIKPDKLCNFITPNICSGFFTKIAIRVYGYDAAEKNTENGIKAKELFENKIKKLNNVIWCLILDRSIGLDPYGRPLALLYEDEDKKLLLNDYLFRKQNKLGLKLVNPYIGRTKLKF